MIAAVDGNKKTAREEEKYIGLGFLGDEGIFAGLSSTFCKTMKPLVDHTGWKLRKKQWTGTTDQLIEDLKAAYDNAPNMFLIRIHHGGKFQRYPCRMYVSGHVDIFDMIDIDLFTVVELNMMVFKLGYTVKSEPMFYSHLRPFTSLDEGCMLWLARRMFVSWVPLLGALS
nr:hypothetical protein [Tanacetum cinerariifolium]